MVDFQYKDSYGVKDLEEIVRILRAPGGCPWDAEQTHQSIRRNFLEEELGDVLLQVVMHARMEQEAGRFDLDGVADGICKKLIYRHPHVFGDVAVSGTGEVLSNWEALKRKEKGQATNTDALEAVARALPALWRAEKVQKKARKAGFDWPDVSGALDKLSEELEELKTAAAEGTNVAEELGDLLFSAVNAARFLKVDPEDALNGATDKFIGRFRKVEAQAAAEEGLTDKSVLTVEGILEFAREAALADVEEAVGRQVRYNTAIAQEGLRGDYGANIGKVLLATYGDDVKIRAKAMAAAGSDARMNGCGLPVVIVSGSGNQGLTASLPVVEYAKELGADWETTLRAVLVSDLITIHLKAEIGRLSAYCGAVSAGCGSGAGIAWLYGREKEPQALLKDVSHTIVNALAVDSGIVCDGAKASCAAKIASAVDAGLLGFYMYQNGQQFRGGDGIISKGVEQTIRNIGLLATQGMRETDREILDIMTTRC